MKTHLDSGNIYYNYLNMKESIYDFMIAQQNERKKIEDFNSDINSDFYLNWFLLKWSDNWYKWR